MKFFFAFLLFVFFTLTAAAQPAQIDSVKKLIANAKHDTTVALEMSILGRMYSESKLDSALQMAFKARQLSRKINFLKGEARALNLEGVVFINIGNYPKSIAALVASLKINEKLNASVDINKNLNNLGIVAANAGDFRQSINYIQQAKALAIATHDDVALMRANTNLGDDYEKMNMLDSARMYTQQGFELGIKLNNISILGITNINFGNIYAKMKNPVVALGYYRTALPYCRQVEELSGICEATYGMARLFEQIGEADSSLHYARL